jgi:hypothetical protein
LRFRISAVAPRSNLEERGIHEEAVNFHRVALDIQLASDGVKAFTGMMLELIAGDPSIVLIDEPEAFLHPALSHKLGREIALASTNSGKRIFVSTHSSSFVMGCILSGAPVNIVRLTYRGGVATARVLQNSEILRLMRNPLLRSVGILSALFYEFVVVTESDADRAFYQEINERLLRYSPERGIPNCLFLNAQNKQTVRTILRPLRELGIATAGIVDVDILKDGGSDWTDFLRSGAVPAIEHRPLSDIRAAIRNRLDATNRNMKTEGGIDLLAGEEREAASNLFDKLNDYGLFVVRNGELEAWLKHLGATGHGPNWLIQIFEKLGENPEGSNYVKPGDGDVWEFIAHLRSWLMNPNRKGIPQ